MASCCTNSLARFSVCPRAVAHDGVAHETVEIRAPRRASKKSSWHHANQMRDWMGHGRARLRLARPGNPTISVLPSRRTRAPGCAWPGRSLAPPSRAHAPRHGGHARRRAACALARAFDRSWSRRRPRRQARHLCAGACGDGRAAPCARAPHRRRSPLGEEGDKYMAPHTHRRSRVGGGGGKVPLEGGTWSD